MANFSENLVRHLYVINSAGDILGDVENKQGYLVLKDANDEPIRTDLVENKLWAKKTLASAMSRTTKAVLVTLDSAVNGGAPIAGEDYILRIEYRQFIAQSDETFYHEFGSVHATAGMSASDLLLKLAKNLALNTKKQEMVEIILSAANTDEVAIDDYQKDSDGDVTGIIIREKEQDWVLGIKEQTPVYFTVSTGTVVFDGDEVLWGTVVDETDNLGVVITNGKKIADLEYFLMGERGDMYRHMGWPNYVPTKYKVNPALAYDTIDIHYAYVGANHAVQKSEKTLTLAFAPGVLTLVEGDIKTAFGITAWDK